MPRKPRKFGNTGFYHIILRGNNRQNLFNDDADRKFFIARLQKYSEELEIEVHAYCLMNNHVHILIGKADKNMSLLVQKLANSYVFHFNRKYDRSGHLFQGRFKSEPIPDDEYFKTVYRYILQNSEKASLGTMEKYRWNSYRALFLKGGSFVNIDYATGLFGGTRNLLDFLALKENGKCMEFDERVLLSDDRAFRLIKKLFGISSPYRLEQLTMNEQIAKCAIMRKKGISMSQIARITGISRAIIRKS